MTRNGSLVSLVFLVLLTSGCTTAPSHHQTERESKAAASPLKRLMSHTLEDYRQHYRGDNLLDLVPPTLFAAVLANTNADAWIRDKWQRDTRSDDSNNIARVFLHAGDAAQNRVSMPLYALTMLGTNYTGSEQQDSPVATWAARSLRANVLGGPQAWALTYALGSHRPTVGPSGWNPWNDNDGVSGHSFYGAVPFLTAARMSDHVGWRYTLYAVSMLPAYARVNDNRHYASQAVMGWSIAWHSTRTIARQKSNEGFTLMPIITPDGGYLMLSLGF